MVGRLVIWIGKRGLEKGLGFALGPVVGITITVVSTIATIAYHAGKKSN